MYYVVVKRLPSSDIRRSFLVSGVAIFFGFFQYIVDFLDKQFNPGIPRHIRAIVISDINYRHLYNRIDILCISCSPGFFFPLETKISSCNSYHPKFLL